MDNKKKDVLKREWKTQEDQFPNKRLNHAFNDCLGNYLPKLKDIKEKYEKKNRQKNSK